ncbi:MAG: sugar phosphate isomerase/epimerase family protein [Bacillota bacterium]
MNRPVTLFTGQWADLPIEEMARKARGFGYDGLELACWGDHFEVARALSDPGYCDARRSLLAEHGLKVWAISNHLVGQIVLDPPNPRSDAWAPAEVAGDPEAKRAWAIDEMKRTARAARRLGVDLVNGFTGSPIWHLIYPFPPVTEAEITAGYDLFAGTWGPILDVFQAEGVRFALEVHPTEIAFDIYTARRSLEAVGNHPAFGFNFDPSHLVWVGVDPVQFIHEFPDRIFHVHVKDAIVKLNGRNSILSSHLPFGDSRRGWDFQSPGRGSVDFREVFRALNQIGYRGPLSVEWEDNGMNREFGATEACAFVRRTDFPPAAGGSFEDAFRR